MLFLPFVACYLYQNSLQRYNFFLIYANIFALFLLFTVNPICQRSCAQLAAQCFMFDVLCVMCVTPLIHSSTHPLILSPFRANRLHVASVFAARSAHNDPSGDRCDAFLFFGQQVRPAPVR